MFDKDYESRLQIWRDFRDSLTTSDNPFQDLTEFYKMAPIVSIHTDPWTPSVWPDPWELVYENQYDEFCILLGICYSMQLSDRFKDLTYEIHIGIDKQKSLTYYLLKAGDNVMDIHTYYGNHFPPGFESQQKHLLSINH